MLPRTLKISAFPGALAAITVLALWPHEVLDTSVHIWDKLQHAQAYLGLTLLGVVGYPGHKRRIALLLLAHGALLEVMQGLLTTTRTADLADFLADEVGVMLAAVLIASGRGLYRRGRLIAPKLAAFAPPP